MSNSPSNGIGLKFLLASAAIIIILAGLKAAQSLISPFLLAVFFALILTPPLAWLKKKGLPDVLATLVLSAVVFLLGLGIVLIFSNSLTQFAEKLPAYKEKVTVGYTTIDTWINTATDKMSAWGETIQLLSPIGEEETEEGAGCPHPNPLPEGEGMMVNPLGEGTNDASEREKFSLSDIIQVSTLIAYVQLSVNALLNIATVSSLVLIMLIFMLAEAARMPGKVKEAFGGRDLSN